MVVKRNRAVPAGMTPRSEPPPGWRAYYRVVARIPRGRLGKAEDIARGVVFLTAEDADFITGSTLSINGGQHMY